MDSREYDPVPQFRTVEYEVTYNVAASDGSRHEVKVTHCVGVPVIRDGKTKAGN